MKTVQKNIAYDHITGGKQLMEKDIRIFKFKTNIE